MRRLAIAAAAALVVGGCMTSAADLRSGRPVAEGVTSRPAADVAGCIVERVQHVGAASVYRGAGGETVVTFTQGAATTALFEIEPGGRVRAWRVNGLIPYRRAMADCL